MSVKRAAVVFQIGVVMWKTLFFFFFLRVFFYIGLECVYLLCLGV